MKKKESRGRRARISRRVLIALAVLILPLTQAALGQEAGSSRIRWHDYVLDTEGPMPAQPEGLAAVEASETEPGYYFVQFTGPITEAMKAEARAAGAELLYYVPDNAFLSRIPAGARTRVAELPVVRWVGVYQPAFRMAAKDLERFRAEGPEAVPPEAVPREGLQPTPWAPQAAAAPPEESLQLAVLVFRGADLEAARRQISEAGGTVEDVSESEFRTKLVVRIPRSQAVELVRILDVMWVEELRIPEPVNDQSRTILNVGPIWNPPNNLKGANQIVAVADSGLDRGVNDATMHDDFEGRIVNLLSWPVQAGYGATNVGADDGAADLDSGHGTHTSGSAVGNGTVSGGTYSGVAPEARLVLQAVEQWSDYPGTTDDGYFFTGLPADLNTLFQQSYDEGARIQNDSWSNSASAGNYTSLSQDVDEFVWNHPDMLIVFAAGNNGEDQSPADGVIDAGSVTAPGTCKNCLTVGATENNRAAIAQTWGLSYGAPIAADLRADNTSGMAAFSGRGPTNDGRIKPDLVAPGTFVISPRSQAPANVLRFTDDMESGVNGWTAQGTWAQVTASSHSATHSWHDSPAGDYAANTTISLQTPTRNLNVGGLADKQLAFWLRHELGTGDFFWVVFSDDGGSTWSSTGYRFAGDRAGWELVQLPIFAPYSQATNFRARFILQSNGDTDRGDGVYIDDLRIQEGAYGWGLLSDFGVATAGSTNDTSYLFMGGTSMSSPLTAGAAALVREYYTDKVGLGYVSAALLRATLVNGTVDLSPGQYGVGASREMTARPNSVEGWGRVNLQNSLFPAAPAQLDWVDELGGLSTGEHREHTLHITDASVPIVLTLVYHDYPGTPGAPQVNELHVSLRRGTTTTHPNGRTTADPDNNVQQIVLPAAQVTAGDYTIRVDAPSVPNGPQPYALVTSAGGTLVDRDPVDVMLVLDVSGSMQSKACATCDPKLDVLKDAVELFIQIWTALAIPSDRLGITYFRSDVDQFLLGGTPLLSVIDNAPAMISNVRSQTTDWLQMTAMGGGIQQAVNDLTTAARRRSIIVFTDGMQNRNPMVRKVTSGTGFYLEIDNEAGHGNSNVSPTSPATRLDNALDRHVSTIGVGVSTPYATLLSDIATKTGGKAKTTTAPDDQLRRFYVEELVDALRGYSPQLLAYRKGRLTGDAGGETFRVNRSARQLILKLSWYEGGEFHTTVEKDGQDLTPYGKVIEGDFYRIFSIDLPVLTRSNTVVDAEGDWTMKITGTPEEPYEAAAIVEEAVLEYDFSVGDRTLRVGEEIPLTVELSVDGRPVTDARWVRASVLRPGTGMGTLLSTTDTPSFDDLQAEPEATGGQKKLQVLLQDPKFFDRLLPVTLPIDLQSQGDGTYSGSFNQVTVPGTYRVVFEVEGEHGEVGSYRRTETLSTVVEIGAADRDLSEMVLYRPPRPTDKDPVTLTIRPRDGGGNYLGPDYLHRIGVDLSQGSVGRGQDLLDGRYRFALSLPPGSDPRIDVRVLDEPLYSGAVSEVPGSDGYRYALSWHLGVTRPTGTFGNFFDGDVLGELDFEHVLSRRFSLIGVLGGYRFDPSFDVLGATLYARRYGYGAGSRFFAELGPGVYDPDFLDPCLGLSGGLGIDRPLVPHWRWEVGADFFHLFNDGDDIEFFAVKLGLRRTF